MIEIDTVSFIDSAQAFEHANHAAAHTHEELLATLAGCGAMAGDASIAEEFAAAYDDAAEAALKAIGDLVDAFATCGRLTETSLDNHGRAENRSMITGRTVYEAGATCLAGYVAVLPCSLPTALGGDLTGIPDWANWILDQIEGFIWPDADCDRLREAAAAWRKAGSNVDDLTRHCTTATNALDRLRSPEVPIAIEVTKSMAGRCTTIADQCHALAQACEQYADHVEEQREAILDLVHDLIRDTVLIQTAGILLGAVTAGATAAGAAALNAGRIAAAAPRFLKIITTLRALAATAAAPLRAAATSLHGVRRELSVFRRARLTLASTYDAERLARVARLQGIVHSNRLLDPNDFRGLSMKQVHEICKGWPSGPATDGVGVVYRDPANFGRQIRVMEGYPPGSRPDAINWGPYVRVSQNGKKPKIPLEGNPTL